MRDSGPSGKDMWANGRLAAGSLCAVVVSGEPTYGGRTEAATFSGLLPAGWGLSREHSFRQVLFPNCQFRAASVACPYAAPSRPAP